MAYTAINKALAVLLHLRQPTRLYPAMVVSHPFPQKARKRMGHGALGATIIELF
jgi:hypothetical protein